MKFQSFDIGWVVKLLCLFAFYLAHLQFFGLLVLEDYVKGSLIMFRCSFITFGLFAYVYHWSKDRRTLMDVFLFVCL